MIISQIYKGQGFGNQLWCMVTAYALALEKKFQYIFLDSSESFLGNDIFDFSDDFFSRKFIAKNKYFEKGYFHKDLNTYLYSFDKNILNVKPSTEIIGNFQSEDYFFNRKDQIKSFFKINEKTIKLSSQFSSFNILNIRGGEYKRHPKLLLPNSYWTNLYSLMKQKSDLPVIIVSDDYHYSKKLFPKLEIISNDIQLCFAALLGSKNNIGVSNSSFSYFPLLLGNQKNNIFAPYQWSRFNNKFNLWASPCNYYNNWQWVKFNGDIANDQECKNNKIFTENFLNTNSLKISFKIPNQEISFKISIKKILKRILGLFNWRYK